MADRYLCLRTVGTTTWTPFSRTLSTKRPGKTEWRFLAKFLPIFHTFSTDFPPMVPQPPFFHPHVYGLRLFPPIFCLFLPIFRLWYPIFIINSSMLPICRFSAHMFTDFANFQLIFRLFSAYFPPIFRLKFCLFSACPVLPGQCQ